MRDLNVSHCGHITDISVMRIARRYMGIFTGTRLILFNNFSCNIVLCCVFPHLIRLCNLYHLHPSYCERLTDMSLEWLSGSFVCSLDISGSNIQDQVLFECLFLTSHVQRKKVSCCGLVCNLASLLFSGAGGSRGCSLKEVSPWWVSLHYRHWHRGTNRDIEFCIMAVYHLVYNT